MGLWSVILPEYTKNLFNDPQFGLADPDTEWDIAGPNAPPDDVTRSVVTQFYGTGCALFTMAGAFLDLTQSLTVVNEPYTMTWLIRRAAGGVVTDAIAQAHFDTVSVNWTSITHVRNGWYRCIHTATATAGARDFGVHCSESGLQSDGAQLEHLGYRTTYCDGEQLGCEWLGGRHASQSQRSVLETRGGRKVDLADYNLTVEQALGAGMAPVDNIIQRYGQQPGGVHKRQDVLPRVFTLTGTIDGVTLAGLHGYRESIIDALKIDRSSTGLPVRLWYSGGATDVYIDCQYDEGMQLGRVFHPGAERVGIRLIAADPNFYQEGEFSTPLDTNDTATLRYVAARLRSTGQWSDLGLTADPDGGGAIQAQLVASDKSIYVGGNFTGFDGNAGWDYLVRYTPSTDTWSRVGGASDFTATVWALAEDPEGTIYVAGEFTDVTHADGDYLVQYNPATNTVSVVSGGGTNFAGRLAVGLNGDLYIGGIFVNWNAIAEADGIVKWNGSAYSALSTGCNGVVQAVAVDRITGDIYLGGAFTTAGGETVNRITKWDGTAFSALGTGMNDVVYGIAVDSSGNVFVVGAFTTAGGVAVNKAAKWNGQAWSALGTGLTGGDGWHIVIAPDGTSIVGGDFTAAGGITLASRVARWNRYTWAHLDIDLPGVPSVGPTIGVSDPVIDQNYDLWIGWDTTGSGYFAGTATITPAGTRLIYPERITVKRTGGTSATLETIRNETIGRELLFDKNLLDGEEVTIRLEPGKRSMESTFVGKRWDTLPASDVADFYLLPQANQITAYVNTAGSPTITAYLVYRQAEWGVD